MKNSDGLTVEEMRDIAEGLRLLGITPGMLLPAVLERIGKALTPMRDAERCDENAVWNRVLLYRYFLSTIAGPEARQTVASSTRIQMLLRWMPERIKYLMSDTNGGLPCKGV